MKTTEEWIPVLNDNGQSWTRTVYEIQADALREAAEIAEAREKEFIGEMAPPHRTRKETSEMTTADELRLSVHTGDFYHLSTVSNELALKAAAELEALQKEVGVLRKDTPTADAIIWRRAFIEACKERDSLRAQNEALMKQLPSPQTERDAALAQTEAKP